MKIDTMQRSTCTQCLRKLHRPLHPRPSIQSVRGFRSCPTSNDELSPSKGVPNAPSLAHTQADQTVQARSTTPADVTGAERPNVALLKTVQKLSAPAQPRPSNSYAAYAASKVLYRLCSSQADYSIPQAKDRDVEMPKTEGGEDLGEGTGWWFDELGLKPTFSAWSHVTMFYMYMFVVRFRCFTAAESRMWQQQFLDHFFYDAENRMMTLHRMHSTATRNRYLKDLHLQWRGCVAAYDEGLQRGDAWLAAAIWRNVLHADTNFDPESLAICVGYMRRILQKLDGLGDEAMLGTFSILPPSRDVDLLESRSKGMDSPFLAETPAA